MREQLKLSPPGISYDEYHRIQGLIALTPVESFMAAVQLGLKRRFGGKVDHLRMVLQDEPGKDGGPRRHYVMLYDSVPGGTGYWPRCPSKGWTRCWWPLSSRWRVRRHQGG